MKTEDNIYIKVLVWAYNKQQTGFTRKELTEQFKLEGSLATWIESIFFTGTNNDRPLIGRMSDVEGRDYFTLSDKGMSAAIDYLELQEVKESGKKTKIIAYWSIGIGVVVGITQIVVAILDSC